MLLLPARIEARLVDTSGRSLSAADVLVGLNVLRDGEYYYGNLVGLTDAQGVAAISRDELDLRFAADKVDYPMDVRTDLEDCDPLLEVFILTEKEVTDAAQAIATSPGISDHIREMYRRARNHEFHPALCRVWGHLPGESTLSVALTTRAAT